MLHYLGLAYQHTMPPYQKPVRGKTRITWESVFADKDGKIVENFKKEIGEFYSKSLRALRKGF